MTRTEESSPGLACKFSLTSTARSNALSLNVLKVAMLSMHGDLQMKLHTVPVSKALLGKKGPFFSLSVFLSFFFQTHIINSYSPIFFFSFLKNLTAYE